MLTNRMVKSLSSSALLAFALVAGQPLHAALPPQNEVQQLLVPPKTQQEVYTESEHRPTTHPFNQNFADALSPLAMKRYAGVQVIGIDIYKVLNGEETFGAEPDELNEIILPNFHAELFRSYPHLIEELDRRFGNKRKMRSLEHVIQAFLKNTHQPQIIPGIACFVNETSIPGHNTESQILDMLIAAHRCNSKYGKLNLRYGERVEFRPQALEDALQVARNVAKIGQEDIDYYLLELMDGRTEELQHAVLVTYVEYLNIPKSIDRNGLYISLQKQLHALQSEIAGKSAEDMTEILHSEWNSKGITAYFAAICLKARHHKDPEKAAPFILGLNILRPLSEFISKADMPAAPAARLAPRP